MKLTGDFTSAVSPQAQQVLQQALDFYNTTFNGTDLTGTITFGAFIPSEDQGGASSITNYNTFSFGQVSTAIRNASSGSATDASAIANLPASMPTDRLQITSTLASALGLSANPSSQFGRTNGCSSLSVLGCIRFGSEYLLGSANPAPGLLATAEHELDEVLGTGSGLSGDPNQPPGGSPSAADLFRYAAAGQLSFSNNPGTAGAACPAGTPIAYLSIDGGATPLVNYNNCNNSGDYGDFVVGNPTTPQDWAGSASVFTPGLTATSSPIVLLDAMGYNLTAPVNAIQSSNSASSSAPLTTFQVSYGGDEDGELTADQLETDQISDQTNFPLQVPEPSSMALLAAPLLLALTRAKPVRRG